jgi:uncharacterized protein
MKILVYMTHPSDFHLLKHSIESLETRGHIVKVFGRHKGDLVNLLESSSFDYFIISKKFRKDSIFNAGLWLIEKDLKMIYHTYKYRPDILIGNCINITHMSKIYNVPSILIRDDDNIPALKKASVLSLPFASVILTPQSTNMGKYYFKQIKYYGFKELAYLHPKRFHPNINIIKNSIDVSKPFYILRLVKLNAHHDQGKTGITDDIIDRIIELLSKHGNIYITSEKALDQKYEKFRISLPAEKIHHAIYFADLYIGDSQTMAAEAAVLGTPSIRYNDFVGKLGYLEELEHKFGLTRGIKTTEPEKLLRLLKIIISDKSYKESLQESRLDMLSKKIDVSAFLVWFVETYPKSIDIMKDNPNYQLKYIAS